MMCKWPQPALSSVHRLKEAKGEEAAVAAWAASGLKLISFVSSMSPDKEDLAAIKADAEKRGLAFLATA